MINNQTKFKETELGLIPEDWENIVLRNLIEEIIDNRGKTPPLSKDGHEMIEVNAIKDDFVAPDYSVIRKFVDDDTYKNWFRGHIEVGDVLVSTVGTIGNISLIKEKRGVVAQNVIALRPKNRLDSSYLYYYLKSPNQKNELRNLNIGGVQPSIKVPHLLNLQIAVPPLPEQQKIVDVLGALDEKIELNQKVNKTLESLAQAIFKKWFVDDADPKWETKKLGDLLDIDRGLSYKGKYLSDVGNPMFNLGSFNLDGSLKLDTLKYYSGDFKKNCTVNAGDIIVANTDMTQNRVILGSPCIIPDLFYDQNVLFTHHLYALRPIDELNKMFIYRSLKTREFKDQAIGFATGTTVLFLPKEAILNYEVKYPSIVKLKEFNSFYSNIVEQQLVLTKEIETLSQIRDSLLPRLMSGKLRLK